MRGYSALVRVLQEPWIHEIRMYNIKLIYIGSRSTKQKTQACLIGESNS